MYRMYTYFRKLQEKIPTFVGIVKIIINREYDIIRANVHHKKIIK